MPSWLASSRRAVALAAVFALLALPATPTSAAAQEDFVEKARSSVTEVANHRFADGSPGNLGYQTSTEILEPMSPGEFLPTVRVDARDHADAFEGQWADNGFHAAWISRAGSSQFFPDSYTVESGYLDNYIDSGPPLAPGDRFDMAVKQLPFDAPLTWDRERGKANGELDWDVATKVHRVSGTYGDHSSEMEVMFVRADLVARRGDFDARGTSADAPPLVIDLPRTYGPDVTVGAVSAQFSPYLHYLRNVQGQVAGQTGKAVFTADLTGYLPEAKKHTIPGGATIREWHIPLDIIITAVGRTGEVGGRSAISMPTDGLVKTFGALGSESLHAPAGASVITGNGIAPEVRTASPDPEPSSGPSESATGSGSLLDDIKALAPIDSSLSEPANVRVAKRSFDLTIDPNLYDSGALGITAARHVRSGRDLVAAAAATSVEVDGRLITLERSRLVELRAVPLFDWIRIRFTARSEGNVILDPSSYSRAREGRIMDPGLTLEAVYDLGNDVFGFFTASAPAEGGDHAQLETRMTLRSLSGEPHQFKATQYLETPGSGPFTYDDAPITNEFSDTARPIRGDRVTYAGNASGGGLVTVKKASDILFPQPVADPSVDLSGELLGVYMTSANGAVTDYYGSYLRVGVSGVAAKGRFPIPDLGESCTEAAVVDDADGDADAGLDIRRAWFDFDGAHVYATLELENLDETMLSPARYRAGWRYDHIGYGLQASRDATGAWTFELGLHPSAGSQWSRIANATGEVAYGAPGYIRIKAPAQTTLARPFFDGEMFRDTGAVSSDSTTTGERVADRAPSGSPETAYGRGDDWTVAPCPGVEIPTTLELLDTPYETQYTDRLVVRSRLVDPAGPVENETVTISFDGRERSVSTDAAGIAEAAFDVEAAPGTHIVAASYPGVGAWLGSDASSDVSVLHEDTTSTVTTTGTGSKRRVIATLMDRDDETSGIAGRTIEFYANGESIGDAATDGDGVATLEAPPRFRGGTHVFEATFAGDGWFLGSSATST